MVRKAELIDMWRFFDAGFEFILILEDGKYLKSIKDPRMVSYDKIRDMIMKGIIEVPTTGSKIPTHENYKN